MEPPLGDLHTIDDLIIDDLIIEPLTAGATFLIIELRSRFRAACA